MKPAVGAASSAVGASFLASGYLAFADTYRGQSCSASTGGLMECIDLSSTLIEQNGSWALILLSMPIALTLIGFVTIAIRPGGGASRRFLPLCVTAALAVFCLISAFSIGSFYFPSLFALGLATLLLSTRRAPAR